MIDRRGRKRDSFSISSISKGGASVRSSDKRSRFNSHQPKKSPTFAGPNYLRGGDNARRCQNESSRTRIVRAMNYSSINLNRSSMFHVEQI